MKQSGKPILAAAALSGRRRRANEAESASRPRSASLPRPLQLLPLALALVVEPVCALAAATIEGRVALPKEPARVLQSSLQPERTPAPQPATIEGRVALPKEPARAPNPARAGSLGSATRP